MARPSPARLRPDVIPMDGRMLNVDGVDATRRIVDEQAGEAAPRIIMLTTFDRDEYVVGALRAGASGFLIKDASPEAMHCSLPASPVDSSTGSPPAPRSRTSCPPRDRPAHGARARGDGPRCERPVQRRDRNRTAPQRGDREDPGRPRPDEAGRLRPRATCRSRLRAGPRPPWGQRLTPIRRDELVLPHMADPESRRPRWAQVRLSLRGVVAAN